jgi:hypothetical protein
MCLRLGCDSGIDLGTDLPTLINALVAVLPKDRSTMLRIGMTNPPYILKHLERIAAILNHPCVYSFLHVPVQSGSDNVLRVSCSKPLLLALCLAVSITVFGFVGTFTYEKKKSLILELVHSIPG